MQMKRQFAYERFRRDIENCQDIKQLQEIAKKLLKLYLVQQEAVEAFSDKGWLPSKNV
jgi:hypothetical protein